MPISDRALKIRFVEQPRDDVFVGETDSKSSLPTRVSTLRSDTIGSPRAPLNLLPSHLIATNNAHRHPSRVNPLAAQTTTRIQESRHA
jgi:hypothetical protein